MVIYRFVPSRKLQKASIWPFRISDSEESKKSGKEVPQLRERDSYRVRGKDTGRETEGERERERDRQAETEIQRKR